MEPKERDLAPVFVARGEVEAYQIQAFLDSAGIPSLLRRSPRRGGFFSVTPRGLEAVTVLVRTEDAAAARDLIARAESGEFRLEEDDVPD